MRNSGIQSGLVTNSCPARLAQMLRHLRMSDLNDLNRRSYQQGCLVL